MCKFKWTILVTISLISGTLAGCAVPGRFSREQYAQLDSDPFISDEPERSTVMTQLADRAASMVTDPSDDKTEDRFAFVADEEFPELQECDACDTPPLAEVQAQPEEALASFFEAPEKPAVPKKLMQAVAQADDEFSHFMENEKNKVVHASAEFIDTVEATQKDVQQTVEQSGFWGYQTDSLVETEPMMQKDEVVSDANPFFDDNAAVAQPNPFADDEAAPVVAPPADVFGDTSEVTEWPPGDFEFN